jgi:hypothetical protein
MSAVYHGSVRILHRLCLILWQQTRRSDDQIGYRDGFFNWLRKFSSTQISFPDVEPGAEKAIRSPSGWMLILKTRLFSTNSRDCA